MIYSFTLQTAGLFLGGLLLLLHGAALLHGRALRALLPRLPRSRTAGVFLLSAAALWAFWLAATVDFGEFTSWRTYIMGVVLLLYVLTLFFVEEFLAVRALGVLLLLAAEPVLEAAFLRPEPSRVLVTALAYGWILCGLFWVGMPYQLRDAIEWCTGGALRWNAAALAGVLYGAALLACGLWVW